MLGSALALALKVGGWTYAVPIIHQREWTDLTPQREPLPAKVNPSPNIPEAQGHWTLV
jgi:hypothetical protein